MRYVVWGIIVLLIIAHQDIWYWDDPTLVFGFMPIGLLYHATISVLAACTWFLATIFAWPHGLEDETLAAISEKPAAGGEGDE